MKHAEMLKHYNNQDQVRKMLWDRIEDRGVSIRALAADIGLNYTTFWNWFTRDSKMTLLNLSKVLDYINNHKE